MHIRDIVKELEQKGVQTLPPIEYHDVRWYVNMKGEITLEFDSTLYHFNVVDYTHVDDCVVFTLEGHTDDEKVVVVLEKNKRLDDTAWEMVKTERGLW